MQTTELQQFINLLESRGELLRVNAETDPRLEISTITNRICKQRDGGQALLFERPGGSSFPVATNLFGSIGRICLALGVENLAQLTEKMFALLEQIPRTEINVLDQQITALPGFSRFSPTTGVPLWTSEMKQPDLTAFPFLQNWPEDGNVDGLGCYITLPQVITVGPDGSSPNCGIYRAQVRGRQELALRWKSGCGASQHLEKFRVAGKPMPVAIALGGTPSALFSAMMPLPGNLDEMTFAGFLRGAPLELSRCRTIPLQVPATAELIIEGYVNPAESVTEGPFGNHTGTYSPAGPAALMHVTSISHRPDAVIPATVVGAPPMEDCWMAKAWERILLAFVRSFVPAISDIHFPMEWIFHQSAIISLEHPNPAMVREIADLLWTMPWFGAARLTVFISADHSPLPESETAWRSINLIDYAHDMLFDSQRQRLALDATGSRLPHRFLKGDPAMDIRVSKRWQEYGIS